MLIIVGVALVAAAILPVFAMLPISDSLQTGLTAAKFLMLPLGAFALAGAAALTPRTQRK